MDIDATLFAAQPDDDEEQAKQAASTPPTSTRAGDIAAKTFATSGSTKAVLQSPIDDTTNLKPEQVALNGVESAEDMRENASLNKVQEICDSADTVVGHMYQIKNHMADFEAYIEDQKAENKPLYQWAEYSDYHVLSHTISGLEEAAATLRPETLPKDEAKLYLRKATQFSLSISGVAVFAMGVMRQKFDTCITDIEDSEMSVQGKDNAKVLVARELEKLIKHCTRATGCVYAALDLLRECLPVEESNQETQLASIKNFILESERRICASRTIWLQIALVVVLGAAITAAISLIAVHATSINKGAATYDQVLDLVQRSQAITNLTGEIRMINMQNLNARYKEIEDIAEAHGLRIDNLVDALGPTNEQGLYYSSKWSVEETKALGGVQHRIQSLSESMDHELRRLHEEIDRMRKTLGRMDVKLSTRLDKVQSLKG